MQIAMEKVNVKDFDFDSLSNYADTVNGRAAWVTEATRKSDGAEGKLMWYMDHPDAEDGADSVDDWDTAHFLKY